MAVPRVLSAARPGRLTRLEGQKLVLARGAYSSMLTLETCSQLELGPGQLTQPVLAPGSWVMLPRLAPPLLSLPPLLPLEVPK